MEKNHKTPKLDNFKLYTLNNDLKSKKKVSFPIISLMKIINNLIIESKINQIEEFLDILNEEYQNIDEIINISNYTNIKEIDLITKKIEKEFLIKLIDKIKKIK